jgi:hypothetical protein
MCLRWKFILILAGINGLLASLPPYNLPTVICITSGVLCLLWARAEKRRNQPYQIPEAGPWWRPARRRESAWGGKIDYYRHGARIDDQPGNLTHLLTFSGTVAGAVFGTGVGLPIFIALESAGFYAAATFAIVVLIMLVVGGGACGAMAGKRFGVYLAARKRPGIPSDLDLSQGADLQHPPTTQTGADAITGTNKDIARTSDS